MSSHLVGWVEETRDYFGQPIRLKLKVPSCRAAAGIIRRLGEIRTTPVITLLEDASTMAWLEETLDAMVRLAEPLEVDGVPVTAGRGLLEATNIGFVLKLLDRLGALAWVTELEGKASASPSTLSAGNGSATDGDSSPAPSIGPVAGPAA